MWTERSGRRAARRKSPGSAPVARSPPRTYRRAEETSLAGRLSLRGVGAHWATHRDRVRTQRPHCATPPALCRAGAPGSGLWAPGSGIRARREAQGAWLSCPARPAQPRVGTAQRARARVRLATGSWWKLSGLSGPRGFHRAGLLRKRASTRVSRTSELTAPGFGLR